MKRKRQILLIGALLLVSQLFMFSDYISPFQWGQLKISGLACTCPDESVLAGRLYLRTITPDSLKQFDLDYSEIYVTNRPYTTFDPQGVDDYIIEGQVIGKDRVSENDPWNPKFRVDKWREVELLKSLLIKVVFFLEVLIWLVLWWWARKKGSAGNASAELAN